MRTLFIAVALLGCQGEQVEPATTTDAGGETASCGADEGNVVQNGSFEIAVGSTLSGWKAPDKGGTITQRKGSAGHCDAWRGHPAGIEHVVSDVLRSGHQRRSAAPGGHEAARDDDAAHARRRDRG